MELVVIGGREPWFADPQCYAHRRLVRIDRVFFDLLIVATTPICHAEALPDLDLDFLVGSVLETIIGRLVIIGDSCDVWVTGFRAFGELECLAEFDWFPVGYCSSGSALLHLAMPLRKIIRTALSVHGLYLEGIVPVNDRTIPDHYCLMSLTSVIR